MVQKIYITRHDYQALSKLIDEKIEKSKTGSSLEDINNEINRAEIVSSQEVPKNVITMNSRIIIMLDDNQQEMTLVYPNQADPDNNKISVLSPIGIALLGCTEGAEFEWPIPSGKVKIVVKKIIYQPEAEGHYYL